MLRVVSESTDTCSHRKGGFSRKHMYLFVLKQQARRGSALRGGALLSPSSSAGTAIPQGAEPSCSWGWSRAEPLARTTLQGAPDLSLRAMQEFFHKHQQLPALSHLSRKTCSSTTRQAAAGLAGYFWVSLSAQEEGEGAGTCSTPHPSPKPSLQAHSPPGSWHTPRAAQLCGARSPG